MILPVSDSLPAPVQPEPLVLGVDPRKKLDRAIIDKALTIKIVEDLPVYYDRMKELALSSESDDTSANMLKYLTDRAAGKARENISIQNTHVLVSADEVRRRLEHMSPSATYEETSD